MKKNPLKYLLSENLYLITGLLTTGTILQTFFLEMGLDEKSISYFEAISLIIQSASIFLLSGFIEKKSDIKGLYILSNLFKNILIIPMLIYCFYRGGSLTTAFIIICVVAFISQISYGVQTVTSYKYPYHVIKMENYGSILAKVSITGHICAAVFSYLIMLNNEKLGFFNSMRYILIFGIVLSVISYIIIYSTKTINEYSENTQSDKSINIFKYRPFYVLLLPNLSRGIFSGVISVAAIIGSYNNALNSSNTLILVTIIEISTMIGSLIYSRICKKDIDGKIILLFSVLSFFSLIFIGTANTYVFIISFFIVKVVSSVIDIAVPVAVTKIVDYSHIGRYSALRMLTHTLGTAIGSAIIINIIEAFGKLSAILFTGICILICGVAYYLYFKNNKNVITNSERS